MYYFCTYFDQNYLPRALALYRSMLSQEVDFRLFVLCMDYGTLETLRTLALPKVIPIPLQELEDFYPRLHEAKSTRSKIEYYFTCGPSWIRYLLEQHAEIELISYIDADLFFFSSFEPLYAELEGSSIGIIEHRHPKRHERRKKFGLYNVGWLAFRRDQHALECLRWWSEKCIEWCYDRIEEDKYADQKYLDQWPTLFQGVRVIKHKGANVAPWNVANYSFTECHDQIWVDDQPLMFFHFHGFKQLRSWLFDTNLGRSGVSPGRVLRKRVFGTYINELRNSGPEDKSVASIRPPTQGMAALIHRGRQLASVALSLISRAYIVVYRKRVL